MDYTLHHGDCLEVMATMADNSVDAVVTDPPYGLSFMGKNWDHGVPGEAFWREALRVAKPGAHLLAFGGTRTFHRLAVAIEDAGWEIRDCVMWVYGSGFPKSHNLKGQWQGWGTALKPAWEPVIVARKPLQGTVAANVLKYGTGAINVDGCRVEAPEGLTNGGNYTDKHANRDWGMKALGRAAPHDAGRWPANVIHDGSDEVVGMFPVTTSGVAVGGKGKASSIYGTPLDRSGGDDMGYGDSGSAARFFYCAKASKADRGEGNTHPTVKPTDLMRYLCRLVTPPDGIVLDPFMGSGSTGKAAILEGFQFIGIEREAEYLAIAETRIKAISPVTQLSLL
jgi:site-specific DNA-methyltransferase (adenine-specific)